MSLTNAAFAASCILCDDHEGGESSGEEERDKDEPEPVQSFTKAHTAYRTVRSDFYMHRIRKHGK